jgi:hypothetical protein
MNYALADGGWPQELVTFTQRAYPIRIIGDPDSQHSGKWSYTAYGDLMAVGELGIVALRPVYTRSVERQGK